MEEASKDLATKNQVQTSVDTGGKTREKIGNCQSFALKSLNF